MASRAQQKEEARKRRLAEEQALTERARRQRRMGMLIGVVVIAAVIVVAAIMISSSPSTKKVNTSSTSPAAQQAKAQVSALLSGIPQAGNRLGSPAAKVTVTEYGDLECPVCRDLALGVENRLISSDVRSGKVQLVYRSFCTATCSSHDHTLFETQQAAALAAGLQQHQWDYVELFYHLQGDEKSNYVNDSYLNGLAQLIPGLSFSKWQSDRSSSGLTNQVVADEQQAQTLGLGGTPTLIIQGPKGQAAPITDPTVPYATLESTIKSVS